VPSLDMINPFLSYSLPKQQLAFHSKNRLAFFGIPLAANVGGPAGPVESSHVLELYAVAATVATRGMRSLLDAVSCGIDFF
jgi:hypothetical protein